MIYKLHKLRARFNALTTIIVNNSESLIEQVKDLGQEDLIDYLQHIHGGSQYLLGRINGIPDSSQTLFPNCTVHELRTPLCFLGYCEMLMEDAQELKLDYLMPDLQEIYSTGKHLLGMINDVADLSKMDTGTMELHIEGFNLDTVLDEIISTHQPLVAKNANTLAIKRPQMLGDMQTDITKLHVILFHLLSNAAKFTKKGTINFKVTPQTRADDKWMVFDVVDNGIGMTDEQLHKLLLPIQTDTTLTFCEDGTNLGIGLTISKQFAELMGGTLEVKSKVGLGSKLTVSLPCVIYYK